MAPRYSIIGSTRALNSYNFIDISLTLQTRKREIIVAHVARLATVAKEVIATDTPSVS
jgi:hypothetical protein